MLEIIEGHSGKNDKVFLLEEFLEDEEFKRVVEYAYDPLVTFGLLKLPNVSPGGGNFKDTTWNVLDLLRERELTGNDAKDVVYNELMDLNKESQEVFKRILKKDLRAGFSSKSINKAMEGLIPEFPYMRCSTEKEVNLENLNWSEGVLSQEKADGMFVNINIYTYDVTFTTRHGQMFPKGDLGLESECRRILKDGFQYHGEMIVFDGDLQLSRKEGNGVLNSLLQGGTLEDGERLAVRLWDLIPLEVVRTKVKYVVPYFVRWNQLLKDVFEVAKADEEHLRTFGLDDSNRALKLIPTRHVYNQEEAKKHFKEVTEKGLEGTILKDPYGEWKDGTSKWQVKMKKERECELRIIELLPGKGKYEDTLGSASCVSEEGELQVNVSGFTDDERNEIWNNPDDWLYGIVTVRYNEVIESKGKKGYYSLFLARFVEKRMDKDTADSLDKILNI
jgi:DNA ligase-1